MRHVHLRSVIIFGTAVLIGLLVVQAYWLKKAFNVAEKQFDHNVQMALKKVADELGEKSDIKKLSHNFFFVSAHSQSDENTIHELIKKEFAERSLNTGYELGIYKADDDTLVYGHYVEATKKKKSESVPETIQRSGVEKNFAIYFPKKKSYLAAELDIWLFSTIALLFMTGFFAYAISSLLRERKFSELKNDFINNMTHEFKTPVTNIKIAGEILYKKIAERENEKVYVDILLKENEKLQHKIEQVLSGVSVDHFKMPSFERVDVHRLIRECAESFQLKVRQRNGIMRLELNAQNASILGDKELLMQSISNVIDNAEKYSEDNPTITLRTKDVKNGIEIDISDAGIGIPSQMKAKVFEKFFRIRTGNVPNVKGFGLGLTFVKSVISSHKGRVDLFSEVNKGTEVRIFLPSSI